MRILNRYLTFDRNKNLVQLLQNLNVPYKEEEKSLGAENDYYSLEFFLQEDDSNFQEQTKQILKFGLSAQVLTEFSKEDEDKAEWFWMSTGQFGYPQPEDNYFKATYATENICLQCEIGKKQIHPFRLKSEPKAMHSQFLGLNWVYDEIFIREEAISKLSDQMVSGINFSNPVLNKSGLPLTTIKQVHVDTILQPGLLSENLITEICQKPREKNKFSLQRKQSPNNEKTYCGQKKFNFPTRGAMTFKREIFKDQSDFVKPFEWFGSGGSATRPILVSQKVRQITIKEKLRGATFTPIQLV